MSPLGTLRIAAPSSLARMHIAPGLPDFMGRYPDLRPDMRISDSVVDLVERAFDAAVRYADLGDTCFVARRIAPDRRVLVPAGRF